MKYTKIDIEEIKRRIEIVHNQIIKIKPETYEGVREKATFIDEEYGEFSSKVYSVLKGSTHPTRARNSQKNKVRGQTPKNKLSLKEIKDKIKNLNLAYNLTLVEETYKNVSSKADFIDEDYGKFSATVHDILAKKSNHPDRTKKIREASCISKYGEDYGKVRFLKSTEVMLEKYGVRTSFEIPGVQERAILTRKQNDKNNLYTSKGEREIISWIRSIGLEPTHFSSGKAELDIYLPDLKLGIEYNGEYWHSEEKSTSGRFNLKIKQDYYKSKGIQVINIWEYHWKTRKEQVKSFLLSKLHKNKSIGARKCEFKVIDKQEAWDLLDKTHIQGHNNWTQLALGCYFEGELIGCATFSMHHRGKDEIVLDRFTCKAGITVIGALNKFSKIASNHFKRDIYSWAHKTISNATGYYQAGWEFVEEHKPDYFYYGKGRHISKQSRMKKAIKTPEGMTEREHAKLDGLLRCYDCGKIKIVYRYKEN
jgi:hypothetical protein